MRTGSEQASSQPTPQLINTCLPLPLELHVVPAGCWAGAQCRQTMTIVRGAAGGSTGREPAERRRAERQLPPNTIPRGWLCFQLLVQPGKLSPVIYFEGLGSRAQLAPGSAL